MKTLSPSLLSADFSKLSEELNAIAEAGAQYIHLDIMDGHFVPNITFGAPVLKSLRPVTDLVFDVHLMIENPERYLLDFAKAGADILNVHVEACTDLGKIVDMIHSLGCKAGVTVKPDTPIEAVASVLDRVEMVLVMTVYPGFSGQKFIPEALDKIPALVKARRERKLNFDIQIDGGVSLLNLRQVLEAGADSIVAGSAVFGAENPKKAAEEFMSVIREYDK
ncbi:ribulose-phosphate 3-epimerase [Lachnospiraceae bacterium NSJ-143]|nr:ribulose-phosphate 3-epimerase [Lachnospiraceae bacterium NSJ-143]